MIKNQTVLAQAVKLPLNYKNFSLKHIYLTLLVGLSLSTVYPIFAQPILNFNLNYVGYRQYDAELNDIWGYVDEQGNEYALVGKENGVSIVDVTDPANLVEVFNVPGLQTVWRDLKTWGDHAYVTCECFNGLLIIDLTPLPDSNNLPYTFYFGDTNAFFQSAHNLYIDEKGYAYLFGANFGNGGAIILDLNVDPMAPVVVGVYDDHYLHDGVVRNDTLWGGAIFVGEAQAIDVTNRNNPQLFTAWKTPSAFTHNMWFSDDGNYLFTTDEVRNGSIGAYDISEPLNPTRVDVWMPADTGIIPHNTHFINDYLVTSHYTIGVSILDVKRPNNMVEVGRYDTSPDYHYQGFHGCWGAYPWLPSGRILATDIERGLFVLEADYKRACYLEGQVTDEHTGNVIFFPQITIEEENLQTEGSIIGEYAMGTLNAGTYSVRFSANGYFDKVIEGVTLENGELTVLDVQLSNWPLGMDEQPGTQKLMVYPNPAGSQVQLSLNEPIVELYLSDMNGRRFDVSFIEHASLFTLNLSHIPAGIFSLHVRTDESLYISRIAIQ